MTKLFEVMALNKENPGWVKRVGTLTLDDDVEIQPDIVLTARTLPDTKEVVKFDLVHTQDNS